MRSNDKQLIGWDRVLHWYRVSARLEADREVDLPVRPYKKSRAIFLHRHGMFSFLCLFILTLFCINYSNNAGLICACLLALLWVVAVLVNHWIVSRLWLEEIFIAPGDEDLPGMVEMVWRLKTKVRPLFSCSIDGQSALMEFDEFGVSRIKWQPVSRNAGYFSFPNIHVSTDWPMSIAYSWFVLRPRLGIVIAPGKVSAEYEVGVEGVDSSLIVAIEGDPEGVRPRNPQDHTSRIAWKPTLRTGKPVTYEWSQSGQRVVDLNWSSELSPDLAWRRLRQQLDFAITKDMAFRVSHPWGVTPVMKGLKGAQSVLCLIGSKALPRTAWGDEKPFKGNALLSSFFASFKSFFGKGSS